MEQKFEIRQLREEDAQAALNYLNEVAGETDFLSFGKGELKITVEQEMVYINRVNEMKNSLLLSAWDKDELVAIGSVNELSGRFSHRVEYGISVKKNYWRKGIAREITKQLINFAKENEVITVIQLQVSAENERAISLYKNFGFKEIGIYEKFFKINQNYYDAILMNLYL